VAQKEWRRLANTLHKMGVLTKVDRVALAAYCAAYARWAEAEEKLKETPTLFKTATCYVQQSPWLGIANKQLEIMGRYMSELGITPASRTRVVAGPVAQPSITFTTIYEEAPKARPIEKLDAMAQRMAPKRTE
jgi:P27 family predicted phage terminase small subunit